MPTSDLGEDFSRSETDIVSLSRARRSRLLRSEDFDGNISEILSDFPSRRAVNRTGISRAVIASLKLCSASPIFKRKNTGVTPICWEQPVSLNPPKILSPRTPLTSYRDSIHGRRKGWKMSEKESKLQGKRARTNLDIDSISMGGLPTNEKHRPADAIACPLCGSEDVRAIGPCPDCGEWSWVRVGDSFHCAKCGRDKGFHVCEWIADEQATSPGGSYGPGGPG